MKDFNIAKYLKENHLGSHAILGNYVDLHALKEVEDLEGLEVVKGFGALKDKKLADKYAEVAKQAGMEDVKVIEKDGVFKIYAKAGQKLNKEEEMELDTEIPYEGPEHKLDGFGDEFQQANPVEEKAGDMKHTVQELLDALKVIEKKYGYKKARRDQEEHKNVRVAPNVVQVGYKIVEDGSIGVSIENKVSRAAFADIKNLLQTKFPDWKINPSSVKKDVDPDTDSKNVLFFNIVKNKSVKEVNDFMDYDDSVNPFPSIVSDEQDKYDTMMNLAHEYFLNVSPIVVSTINAFKKRGFNDQDIIDFLSTDWKNK